MVMKSNKKQKTVCLSPTQQEIVVARQILGAPSINSHIIDMEEERDDLIAGIIKGKSDLTKALMTGNKRRIEEVRR